MNKTMHKRLFFILIAVSSFCIIINVSAETVVESVTCSVIKNDKIYKMDDAYFYKSGILDPSAIVKHVGTFTSFASEVSYSIIPDTDYTDFIFKYGGGSSKRMIAQRRVTTEDLAQMKDGEIIALDAREIINENKYSLYCRKNKKTYNLSTSEINKAPARSDLSVNDSNKNKTFEQSSEKSKASRNTSR